MNDLNELHWLEDILISNALKQVDLARGAGIPQNVITQIINGSIKRVKREYLIRMSKYFHDEDIDITLTKLLKLNREHLLKLKVNAKK